jgi:hypothetical protein
MAKKLRGSSKFRHGCATAGLTRKLEEEIRLLALQTARMKRKVESLNKRAFHQEQNLHRHSSNYNTLFAHALNSIKRMGTSWLEGKPKFASLHLRMLKVHEWLFWDEKHYVEINSEPQM